MKKGTLAVCSVAAAVVLGSFAVANAQGGDFICHFPGHNGDFLFTGDGSACANSGGIAVIRSVNALLAHIKDRPKSP